MSGDVLVSVIIPVYNVKEYLREAINSVINQTYINLEIIIIDDGSTDGSGAICDEYDDLRIKVFHQPNGGLSNARNTGLNNMSGDIVAFLDSDDYLYPHMIQTMIDELRKKNADIVICNFDWEGRKSSQHPGLYSSISALKQLVKGRLETAVWNKIYKAELWKDIRFPEGHVFEGTRTTYKLIEKAKSIWIISDRLMFHRIRPGSITQTRSINNEKDKLLAAHEFEVYVRSKTPEIFTKEELDRYLERRFLGNIIMWAAMIDVSPTFSDELCNIIILQDQMGICRSMTTKLIYWIFKIHPRFCKLLVWLYLRWRHNVFKLSR